MNEKGKIYIFSVSFVLMNRKFKRTASILNRNLCKIINVFTLTFDQLNASLLNKRIKVLISFKMKSH